MPEAAEDGLIAAARWQVALPRIAAFVALFVLLQFSWQSLRGSAIEYVVIHYGAVRPAAWLIDLLSPELQVRAVDFSVRAPGGGLNILNGCEGLDALFLLVAALAVAGVSVRDKVQGVLYGVPLVLLLNQARIFVLFHSHRHSEWLFDLLHAAVAPIVVVLAITLYFHSWVIHSRKRAAASA